MNLLRRLTKFLAACCVLCLFAATSAVAQTADSIADSLRSRPSRISVKPVFLVPTDAQAVDPDDSAYFVKQLKWAQDRYRELFQGQDTFRIESLKPHIVHSKYDTDHYLKAKDAGAEDALLELFEQDGVDRYTCPYVYVVMFVGTGARPGGGGRPINGGVNTGGGIVILAAASLKKSPNFQSTLQHELGHAFGLPHVNVYGYSMSANPSLMSYNPHHHTNGLEPSTTPGVFIPEDYRVLIQNRLAFPKLHLKLADVLPTGYEVKPQKLLGPMTLRGQPDYAAEK